MDLVGQECHSFSELEPPALGMKSYQVLQLPIKRKQEKVHLDPALASRLEPIQFKTGLSASTLTGKLDARDNKYSLKVRSPYPRLLVFWLLKPYCFQFQVLNEEEGGTLYSASERMLPRHPWGSVDTAQLLHLLSQHGLLDARVEDTPRGVVIHLVHLYLHWFRICYDFLFNSAERRQCNSNGRLQYSCFLPRRSIAKDFEGYFAAVSTVFVNITIIHSIFHEYVNYYSCMIGESWRW